MAKILMAWELGANYGHLMKQLPIALELRSRGHELLFAVRDMKVASELLAGQGFSYLQAPCMIQGMGSPRLLVNYAGMLLTSGYGDARILQGMIQGWLRLFDKCQADVVIADHSPTALLAAQIAGVRSIAIGTGFAVPPDRLPSPSIRSWESISAERLMEVETLALERINACLQDFKPTLRLNRVAGIFNGAAKVLLTFPELDHYGQRYQGPYAGALYSSADARGFEWQSQAGPRILAYLRPSLPGFAELLGALKAAGGDVICVSPGITQSECDAGSTKNFRISTQAIDVDPLFDDAHLVVSMGGSGMVVQAMLRGVPMLLVPTTVEQYMQSRRVEAMGAGITVDVREKPWEFADKVRRLLDDASYRECARTFAKKYAMFSPQQPLAAVAHLADGARE